MECAGGAVAHGGAPALRTEGPRFTALHPQLKGPGRRRCKRPLQETPGAPLPIGVDNSIKQLPVSCISQLLQIKHKYFFHRLSCQTFLCDISQYKTVCERLKNTINKESGHLPLSCRGKPFSPAVLGT